MGRLSLERSPYYRFPLEDPDYHATSLVAIFNAEYGINQLKAVPKEYVFYLRGTLACLRSIPDYLLFPRAQTSPWHSPPHLHLCLCRCVRLSHPFDAVSHNRIRRMGLTQSSYIDRKEW